MNRAALAISALVLFSVGGCFGPTQGRGSVFLLVLENRSFADAMARSGSPLARLAAGGLVLENYYGVAHDSLPNYIALISGQPPNPETRRDCPVFKEVDAGGNGCVYPPSVSTIADQLSASGRTWRAYAEGMTAEGNATCRHPAVGANDSTQQPGPRDQYAVRHVPFLYFRSIIDQDSCKANVVDLAQLGSDLASGKTPDLAFIVPDLCSDGHTAPCPDGRPGGDASMDAFLAQWIPRVQASTAYSRGGVLLMLFDEAPGDNAGCCGEPGGGHVPAVIISPCQPHGVDTTPYNHYSTLRGVEGWFGVAPLAEAAKTPPLPFLHCTTTH
jgi:hypothetical protein